MKKYEKVLALKPLTMEMTTQRAKEIAAKWSHKGLDLLIKMWRKYDSEIQHYALNGLLIRYRESQLHLEHLENALKGIK